MKKAIIGLFGLALSLSLWPQEETHWSFADLLPGGWFPTAYFEAYHPETTFLIEESNGFTLVDRPWLYYDGWSPRSLPWSLNQVSFNSRLFPGTPLSYLPYATHSAYALTPPSAFGLEGGVTLKPWRSEYSNSISFSTVLSKLGSYSPALQFLISTPATQRNERLYRTRRHYSGHYLIDGQFAHPWGEGNLFRVAFTHNTSDRLFNDFRTRDSQFNDLAQWSSVYSEFEKTTSERKTRIWFNLNRLNRENWGAETGNYPQEGLELEHTTWMAGVMLQRWGLEISVALGHEQTQSLSNYPNYTKDLIDNDGDFIFNQSPFGERRNLLFNGRVQPVQNVKRWFMPFVDWEVHFFNAQERSHAFNPVTLGQKPYALIEWDAPSASGAEQSNQLYRAASGLIFTLPLSDSFRLGFRGEAVLNGLSGETLVKNASFLGLGLHASMDWLWGKRGGITLSASRFPHPLNGDVVDFLETSRPSGSWFRWDDLNTDGHFDNDERGGLLRKTGGQTHQMADDFKAPMVNQLNLSFRIPLSQAWRFELGGRGKKVYRPWTVRYPESYGEWREFDGQRVYLLDRTPSAFQLTNLENDRQVPQYWQLMFRFLGEEAQKWYFSFSFMAHMGLGETPFGNGPGQNDYLAISETSADPNIWMNNYGRLDGDRAFVAKLSYALFLSKRFTLGVSAKYRDGNPFAFLSARTVEDQLILQHLTLKGEDQYGGKLGPREDYLSEVNIKLAYRIPLLGGLGRFSLEWYNLLDVGYELSEYVFLDSGRPAMELNLPRSLRLTISWQDQRQE